MKITIPSQDKEVCDICRRDGFLKDCLVCKGRYCLVCEALLAGCVHHVDACRTCASREDVQVVTKRWAPRIAAVIRKRNNVLSHLPKTLEVEKHDQSD